MRTWTTSDQPMESQFAYWREVICDAFVRLDPRIGGRSEGFASRVVSGRFGDMSCSLVESQSQRVIRNVVDIRSDDQDCLFVNLQLKGHAIVGQGGLQAVVPAGDFIVVDTARPYELEFTEPFSLLCLRLPRGRLVARVGADRSLHARRLSGADGAGRVFGAYVKALFETGDGLAEPVAHEVESGLTGLLALVLTEQGLGGGARSRAALLLAARDLVAREIADPNLSAASVAAALCVSVRQLHRLFEDASESFAALVRRLRLERCALDLENPSDTRPVGEVAFQWGFNDSAHFSRAFRARYGCSPRQYRLLKSGCTQQVLIERTSLR